MFEIIVAILLLWWWVATYENRQERKASRDAFKEYKKTKKRIIAYYKSKGENPPHFDY
jgi:adenylate kinase family enzyme